MIENPVSSMPTQENLQTVNQTPPSPIPTPQAKRKIHLKILLGILIVLLFVGGAAGYFVYKQQANPKQKACTMEAKVCPDGSSVGRTGPNCEFTPCPTTKVSPTSTNETIDTSNWKTHTNISFGFSLKYPSDWKIDDNSVNKSNYKYAGISLESPTRYDFSGYEKIGAHYLLQIDFTSSNPKVNYQGFVKNYEKGDQALEYVKTDFKSSDEYKAALAIFESSKSDTPTPTCIPRPACLDATPRCMIPEPANGWCP